MVIKLLAALTDAGFCRELIPRSEPVYRNVKVFVLILCINLKKLTNLFPHFLRQVKKSFFDI